MPIGGGLILRPRLRRCDSWKRRSELSRDLEKLSRQMESRGQPASKVETVESRAARSLKSRTWISDYKKVQENLTMRDCAESHGLTAELYHRTPVITTCRQSVERPCLENSARHSTKHVGFRKEIHSQRLVQTNLAYTSQSLRQPMKPLMLAAVSRHKQQSNVEHHRQKHSSSDSFDDRDRSNSISLVESKHLVREQKRYLWDSGTLVSIDSNKSFDEVKTGASKKKKKYLFHEEENLSPMQLSGQETGDSHLKVSESHYDSLTLGSPNCPVTLEGLVNVYGPSLDGRSNTLRSILKSSQTSASLHRSMLSLGDSNYKANQKVPVDGKQPGIEDPFLNTVENRNDLSDKYSDRHLHSSMKFQAKSSYCVSIVNTYTKQHRAPNDLWIQDAAECLAFPGFPQTRENNSSPENHYSKAQEEDKSDLRSKGIGSRTQRIRPATGYSKKYTSPKGEIFNLKSESRSHSCTWEHGPKLMEALVSNVPTDQFLKISSLRDSQQLQGTEPRGFPLDGSWTERPVKRYLKLYHQRLLSQCLYAWNCFVQQRYAGAISLQERQLLRKGLHALRRAVQLTQIQVEFLERRQCAQLLAHSFKRWRDAASPNQCQLVAGAPNTTGKSCAIHLRKPVTLQFIRTKTYRPWRNQQEAAQLLSLASLHGQKTVVHWFQAPHSKRLGELTPSTQDEKDRHTQAAILETWAQDQAACTTEVWLLMGKKRLWAMLNDLQLHNKGTLKIHALLTGDNYRQLQIGCFDAWTRFVRQKIACQQVLERRHIERVRSLFLQWRTMLQLRHGEKVHLFQLCHMQTCQQTTALGCWSRGEDDEFIQDGVSETCVQGENVHVSRRVPQSLDGPDQTLQPAFQDWRKETLKLHMTSEFCRIPTWNQLQDGPQLWPEESFQPHLQGFSKHLLQQDCTVTLLGAEESSDTNCSSSKQGIVLRQQRLHETKQVNRADLERAGKWLWRKVEKHLVEQHLALWAARLRQVRRVERFCQRSLLSRAFLSWTQWRQGRWRSRELVERFSFVRQCRVVLTLWKMRLLQKLEADRRCRETLCRQIQKAMSQWRTYTSKIRQLYDLQANFHYVKAQKVKLLILSTWQQKAESQRNMKTVADGMVQRRYLRAWHLATLRTEERRQNLWAFQTGQTRRALWGIFSWWKYRCELRCYSEYHRQLQIAQRAAHCWRQRTLLGQSIRHRHTVLTQIFFRSWKEAVRLSQLSHQLAGNIEERRLRLLLNAWANLVKERKDVAVRLRMMVSAAQQRVMQAALHQMVALYWKQKEADRLYRLTLLRRSLLSWVEFMHQQKQWALTVSAQVSVLRLSSVFVMWINQLTMHRKLILLLQRRNERILQKVLRTWYREMQAVRHHSRNISQKFVSRWVRNVLARKQANLQNGMEYRAEKHYRNQLWKRFLKIWWHKTLLQQFLEKKRVEEVQAIWEQWKGFTVSMLVTRGLCQQKLEGKAWQIWRRRFVQMQVLRQFAAQDDRILMSDVFTAWYSLTVVKQGDLRLPKGDEFLIPDGQFDG
ncbi:uncharacterized protein LOC144691113 [Cetorhinus maximus]